VLTRFSIDNFKSFVDFCLPISGEGALGKFVCLIGLNGAGKSSLLQAIDFVAQIATGDVAKWLESRGLDRSDLVNKGSKKRNISFEVEFQFELGLLSWDGVFNPLTTRCTKERLAFKPNDYQSVNVPHVATTITLEDGVLRSSLGGKQAVLSDYEGSVFNKIRPPSLEFEGRSANIIWLLKMLFDEVKSLELLSPQELRRASKKADDVGRGGESLAAFVDGLSAEEKKQLSSRVATFYPRVKKVSSKSGKYGWKRLKVLEEFSQAHEFDSRLINDGLLRISAVVAQTVAESGVRKQIEQRRGVQVEIGNPSQKGYEVVLLDEVENGINPEMVERLVKYLLEVRQQIFVTTHSPLVLNYLPDEIAKESVFILYRCNDGSTHARRFFSLESAAEKLKLMGPGEVFLDLKLEEVSAHLASGKIA
jgi:predicted ATPase